MLRKEYWKHQVPLIRYYDIQSVDVATVDEQMLLQECRGRHGRLFSWMLHREQCAAHGGCCGCTCGCCEKRLGLYLQSAKETGGKEQGQGQSQ